MLLPFVLIPFLTKHALHPFNYAIFALNTLKILLYSLGTDMKIVGFTKPMTSVNFVISP